MAHSTDIRSDALTGYLFAIGASIGLGAAVAFSRAAYDGGSDPLTVATFRGYFGVFVVWLMCLATGQSIRISFRQWIKCAGLGCLVSVMYYGNIASVQYVPIGLAALLFFIYPPLVAIFMAVLDRQRLAFVKILALATSFLGLAVMLGVDLKDLNLYGVAVGLAAGLACALNATSIGRYMGHLHPFVLTFHMATVGTLILTVAVFFVGGLTMPETNTGWYGALGVVISQGISIPFFYAAISKIGAGKTSMLNNIQPVASILIAYLLYTEALTVSQGIGGAMVVGGILLMQWYDNRQQRATIRLPSRAG